MIKQYKLTLALQLAFTSCMLRTDMLVHRCTTSMNLGGLWIHNTWYCAGWPELQYFVVASSKAQAALEAGHQADVHPSSLEQLPLIIPASQTQLSWCTNCGLITDGQRVSGRCPECQH